MYPYKGFSHIVGLFFLRKSHGCPHPLNVLSIVSPNNLLPNHFIMNDTTIENTRIHHWRHKILKQQAQVTFMWTIWHLGSHIFPTLGICNYNFWVIFVASYFNGPTKWSNVQINKKCFHWKCKELPCVGWRLLALKPSILSNVDFVPLSSHMLPRWSFTLSWRILRLS